MLFTRLVMRDLTALTFLFFKGSHALIQCPLFNQVYPAPRNLTNSSVITESASKLAASIGRILASNTTGTVTPLDTLTTSFSVDVFSRHGNQSLFTYHYSAPAFANDTAGVQSVDSDTQYR